jgi:hypothetical protein
MAKKSRKGGYKKGRTRTVYRAKSHRRSFPKWKRKPVHLLTDALEAGGLLYAGYSIVKGDLTGAAGGAAAALVGAGGKSLAKSHRIGKVHKVTNTMGVKLI